MSEIKHFVYPSTGVEHYGAVIDSKEGFDVIECETCGFKHIIPIPTPEELNKFYKEDFYSIKKPIYIKNRFEDVEWWNLHYNDIYDFLEKNVGSNPKILDIGCGPGFFCLCGKKRGWDTLGIEPGEKAVEYAKSTGIEVIKGFFEEVDVSQYGPFDVVYIGEVLEHMPSPENLLKYVYKNLREGGIICVVAANDYNPLQDLLRNNLHFEPWFVSEEHINYFNIKSATKLLEKCSFTILHKEVTFPMELFLLMGQNYVGDAKLGRKCHLMRKQLELNLCAGEMTNILRGLYNFFMENDVGREFIIFGKKS